MFANRRFPPAVCSRGVTSLYWMRNRGFSARMETPIRLRGLVALFAVRLWIPESFHRQG